MLLHVILVTFAFIFTVNANASTICNTSAYSIEGGNLRYVNDLYYEGLPPAFVENGSSVGVVCRAGYTSSLSYDKEGLINAAQYTKVVNGKCDNGSILLEAKCVVEKKMCNTQAQGFQSIPNSITIIPEFLSPGQVFTIMCENEYGFFTPYNLNEKTGIANFFQLQCDGETGLLGLKDGKKNIKPNDAPKCEKFYKLSMISEDQKHDVDNISIEGRRFFVGSNKLTPTGSTVNIKCAEGMHIEELTKINNPNFDVRMDFITSFPYNTANPSLTPVYRCVQRRQLVPKALPTSNEAEGWQQTTFNCNVNEIFDTNSKVTHIKGKEVKPNESINPIIKNGEIAKVSCLSGMGYVSSSTNKVETNYTLTCDGNDGILKTQQFCSLMCDTAKLNERDENKTKNYNIVVPGSAELKTVNSVSSSTLINTGTIVKGYCKSGYIDRSQNRVDFDVECGADGVWKNVPTCETEVKDCNNSDIITQGSLFTTTRKNILINEELDRTTTTPVGRQLDIHCKGGPVYNAAFVQPQPICQYNEREQKAMWHVDGVAKSSVEFKCKNACIATNSAENYLQTTNSTVSKQFTIMPGKMVSHSYKSIIPIYLAMLSTPHSNTGSSSSPENVLSGGTAFEAGNNNWPIIHAGNTMNWKESTLFSTTFDKKIQNLNDILQIWSEIAVFTATGDFSYKTPWVSPKYGAIHGANISTHGMYDYDLLKGQGPKYYRVAYYVEINTKTAFCRQRQQPAESVNLKLTYFTGLDGIVNHYSKSNNERLSPLLIDYHVTHQSQHRDCMITGSTASYFMPISSATEYSCQKNLFGVFNFGQTASTPKGDVPTLFTEAQSNAVNLDLDDAKINTIDEKRRFMKTLCNNAIRGAFSSNNATPSQEGRNVNPMSKECIPSTAITRNQCSNNQYIGALQGNLFLSCSSDIMPQELERHVLISETNVFDLSKPDKQRNSNSKVKDVTAENKVQQPQYNWSLPNSGKTYEFKASKMPINYLYFD